MKIDGFKNKRKKLMKRSSINDHNKLDFIGMYDELLITSISFIFLLNAQVKFNDELH